MRKLKFRAWNGKRWVREENLTLKDLENGLYKFQQYTGLKDKNGKEIYEGDVVKFHRWNSPVKEYEDYLCSGLKKIRYGLVGGQYPTAAFVAISLNPADLEDGSVLDCMLEPYCEIIGNIFENPDIFKYERY